MKIKSEIRTWTIRSLGFQDIREGVTLRRLILQSLECIFGRTTCQKITRDAPLWGQSNQITIAKATTQ